MIVVATTMSDDEFPNARNLEQMFYGRYDRPLDNKGRITLPAPFRDALGSERAVITRGLDRCLFLAPAGQFELWRQRVRAMKLADQRARSLRRHLFAEAGDGTPDAQGRITLPPFLRHYAGIEDMVVVAGVDTHIEIWNAKRWAEMNAQAEASGDDSAWWNEVDL